MAVARHLRRFGSTRVNIRGVEDNRATQMVDGVRMPYFEALLGYSRTDAGEFDNQGAVESVSGTRTRPNPQDIRDQGLLAVRTPSPPIPSLRESLVACSKFVRILLHAGFGPRQ